MKTNSDASKTLYLGLDVHKAETLITILESDRDAQPRHYGYIATTQHAFECPCDFSAPKNPSLPHHKTITNKGFRNHHLNYAWQKISSHSRNETKPDWQRSLFRLAHLKQSPATQIA